MRIVKRYSNRKLYDTEGKKYVTLEDIEHLVRQGEDVKVLDNETEEDVTTLTLSQVIVEKERMKKNTLPKAFFTSVLQSGVKLRETLTEKADKLMSGRVEALVAHLRLPTRNEFDALAKTVARLESKVKALERKLKSQGEER